MQQTMFPSFPKADVRIVCFDLGRVLVRICDNWAQAWRLAGLGTPAQPLEAAVEASVHALVRQAEEGRLAPLALYIACAKEAGIPAAQVEATLRAWIRGTFPGADALLESLGDKGIPTACLSNTHALHWEIMSGSDYAMLMGRLTHRFASHLMGLRKPAPEIYQQVQRISGLAAPQILFFDDLEENIAAARRLGWLALRIDDRDDPVAEMAMHLRRMGVL